MTHRKLQDMTLDELWELFPIVLTPHCESWIDTARAEVGRLERLLSEFAPVINHVGSTAIPDIQAKPIIDILVEVSPDVDWARVKIILEANGYICMSQSDRRVSFNKGYTTEGYAEEVFHIHCRYTGDNDEILFRDYLTAHPEVAKDYERLKMSLLPRYKNDRNGYTEAKTGFVKHVVALAKGESI